MAFHYEASHEQAEQNLNSIAMNATGKAGFKLSDMIDIAGYEQ